jgi:hypothetical protein
VGGLLHLAIGQGIAQADIHGGRPPCGGIGTAYLLVAKPLPR